MAEVGLSLVAAPGVAVGFLVSASGARRLDAGRARPAVLTVAALAAVSVLADAVL